MIVAGSKFRDLLQIKSIRTLQISPLLSSRFNWVLHLITQRVEIQNHHYRFLSEHERKKPSVTWFPKLLGIISPKFEFPNTPKS